MRLRTARDYLRAEDKRSRCLRCHKVPLSPLKGAHAAQRVDAAGECFYRDASRLGLQSDSEEDGGRRPRSEEHTSELQSRLHLVCRLLLEKKKKDKRTDVFVDNRRAFVLSDIMRGLND